MKHIIVGQGALGKSWSNFLKSNHFDVQVYHSLKKLTSKHLHANAIYYLAVQDYQLLTLINGIEKCPKTTMIVVFYGSFQYRDIHINLQNKIIVFHPMMTFTKNVSVDFSSFYFTIRSENKGLIKRLKNEIKDCKLNWFNYEANSIEAYHLLGIFAGNFIQLLFLMTEELAIINHINRNKMMKLLLPIARKSLENIEISSSSFEALSGPFKRNDQFTIAAHLQQLKKINPNLHQIYLDFYRYFQSLGSK